MAVITGDDFSNSLAGTDVDDTLYGYAGNDTLNGGLGADLLIGGTGDDDYIVDDAGDVVIEDVAPGIDEVFTSLNAYSLTANVENVIFTGSGDFTGQGNGISNYLQGGAGNDTLDGGAFNDTMWGMGGNDVYIVDNGWDIVWEDVGGGYDEIRTSLSSLTLGTHEVEALTFIGSGNFTGTGNALDNHLTGGAGDDTLDGGDGHDRLDGGLGADLLIGGAGHDDYIVDDAGDVVIEDALPGIDEVFTSLNAYSLTANVENVIFTGSGDFTGQGNGISNYLQGGAGNDTLDGGAFNDTMWGMGGNDVYVVDNGLDIVWEDAGGGYDEIRTSLSSLTLGTHHVEALTFIGSGNFTGTGNALDNRLTGGAGDDTLDGGDGVNQLTGGAGSDLFVFGPAGTQIVTDFDAAADRIAVHGFASAQDALAAMQQSGDDVLLFSGTASLTLSGVTLADVTTANLAIFGM